MVVDSKNTRETDPLEIITADIEWVWRKQSKIEECLSANIVMFLVQKLCVYILAGMGTSNEPSKQRSVSSLKFSVFVR